MSSRFSRTIYVGNLPLDIRESEIDDLFYKVCFTCPWWGFDLDVLHMNCIILYVVKGVANYDWCTCVYYFIFLLQYGRIVDIELKIPSRPPCFCFVEVFLYNLASKKKRIQRCLLFVLLETIYLFGNPNMNSFVVWWSSGCWWCNQGSRWL